MIRHSHCGVCVLFRGFLFWSGAIGGDPLHEIFEGLFVTPAVFLGIFKFEFFMFYSFRSFSIFCFLAIYSSPLMAHVLVVYWMCFWEMMNASWSVFMKKHDLSYLKGI